MGSTGIGFIDSLTGATQADAKRDARRAADAQRRAQEQAQQRAMDASAAAELKNSITNQRLAENAAEDSALSGDGGSGLATIMGGAIDDERRLRRQGRRTILGAFGE